MSFIKPTCERCRTNVNMVDLGNYWRCAFCGIKKKKYKINLNYWIKNKK